MFIGLHAFYGLQGLGGSVVFTYRVFKANGGAIIGLVGVRQVWGHLSLVTADPQTLEPASSTNLVPHHRF